MTWLTGPQMARPDIRLCRHLCAPWSCPGDPPSCLLSVSCFHIWTTHAVILFTCLTLILKSLLKCPSFRETSLQPQVYLFISDCAESVLPRRLFSSCGERGLLWCLCSGCSLRGLSSCGARALGVVEGPCLPRMGSAAQSASSRAQAP